VISHSPITSMHLFTVRASCFFDPIVAMSIRHGEVCLLGLWDNRWQRKWHGFSRRGLFWSLGAFLFAFLRKHLGQMGFNSKAWLDGLHSGIGFDFGRIEIQVLTPDEMSLLALLDNRFKK